MAQTTMATVTPQQQNLIARQAVIRQGVDMWLPIFSRTYSEINNQGPGTVENLPLRNVGLIKRLLISVSATFTAGATDMHLTDIGTPNFLSNVTLTDLSNQTRINTTGWHLYAVATAKRRRPYGQAMAFGGANGAVGEQPPPGGNGAISLSTAPTGYGNNHGVLAGHSPITAGTTGPVNMYYEVPCSYTDQDLRGAIYANVTNATLNLQFTVNPRMFGTIGQPTEQLGVYRSTDGSGSLTRFTVTVYQNFLDQLPIAQQGGPVLPLLDLSTAYLLNNTSISGIVANQDNPVPFANFRDFLSFMFIYHDKAYFMGVSGGVSGTNTAVMINYLALQSANYTNILRLDPGTNLLMSRLIIEDDFPFPMFYFDFRHRPISTIQYGNMEMIINPGVVSDSTSAFFAGFEALALINMITQAGSLYGS